MFLVETRFEVFSSFSRRLRFSWLLVSCKTSLARIFLAAAAALEFGKRRRRGTSNLAFMLGLSGARPWHGIAGVVFLQRLASSFLNTVVMKIATAPAPAYLIRQA